MKSYLQSIALPILIVLCLIASFAFVPLLTCYEDEPEATVVVKSTTVTEGDGCAETLQYDVVESRLMGSWITS